MRQIENRTNGSVTGFNGKLGAHKMRAAAKVAIGERIHKKRKDLEAQNAYRRAIGLPEVQ